MHNEVWGCVEILSNALLAYKLTLVPRAGLAAEIIWDWNKAVSFQFSEGV